jgi:hypothetical protein
MCQPSITIVLTLGLMFSSAAAASGSYTTTIANEGFRYTFAERTRKIFSGGDQAEVYFTQKKYEAQLRYLEVRPQIDRVLADARKKGVPIVAADMSLSELVVGGPIDVTAVDEGAFPMNVVFAVDVDSGRESVTVTASKRFTAKQVDMLQATFQATLLQKPRERFSEEHQEKDQAALAAAAFSSPAAVAHVDEFFAVYVGARAEVTSADKASVLAPLQTILDAVLPQLRARMAAPDVAAQLHVTGLRPVKPLVANEKQGPLHAFRPWGPLYGGDFLRSATNVGAVHVIVMVAPQEDVDDVKREKTYRVMAGWLDEGVVNLRHKKNGSVR